MSKVPGVYSKLSKRVVQNAERMERRLRAELSGIEVRDIATSRRSVKFDGAVRGAAARGTEGACILASWEGEMWQGNSRIE